VGAIGASSRKKFQQFLRDSATEFRQEGLLVTKRTAGIVGWLAVTLLLSGSIRFSAQARQANRKPQSSAVADRSEADHPVPAERNPRYRICRDDVLLLSFPLSPELNQKVMVQPDGFISLQTAGDVHVEGLTVRELAEAVKKAYAHILHDPIVDVDLADFQKPLYTVLGQVGKPGQYDLRNDITVTQAIAVAGGFAPTAKTQVFLYRAVSANWAEVRELKLKDLLNGKNISEDVHLRPGDMIFVPEKFISNFKKYVPYSFNISPPYPATF
jgi:protein involved in polysaccharide export with SLBB domain